MTQALTPILRASALLPYLVDVCRVRAQEEVVAAEARVQVPA